MGGLPDAFHEAGDLIDQCQAYRTRYGAYPAKVLADGVYGTRANRRWLKARGIAFGGKPLGRPPGRAQAQHEAIAVQRRLDARTRIPIEGKFGQGKGAYGLAWIAARRADTSQAWIRAIFLVMNLIALVRPLFLVWVLRRLAATGARTWRTTPAAGQHGPVQPWPGSRWRVFSLTPESFLVSPTYTCFE